MAKRKQQEQEPGSDGESDSSSSERSLVDVDFDFFDPNPAVDFLALKRLVAQLFAADAPLVPAHGLAELLLDHEPRVGSAVKCDGEESDPYAFLTVLDLVRYKDRPAVQALTAYILDKARADPTLHSKLLPLLGPNNAASASAAAAAHVGFVFSERLVNMPVQIVPHMYRLLADEICRALDENEPFDFKYLVLISRVYRLSAEEAAALEQQHSSASASAAAAPRAKRQKHSPTQAAPPPPPPPPPPQDTPLGPGVYPLHPEDDDIRKFATHVVNYPFTNAQPRDPDSFGLDLSGQMMLIPAHRLPEIVAALADAYPPPSEP